MRGGYCWEVFLRELLSHIFHLLYHRPGSKHEWMAPASVWGTLQSGNDIFPRQCVAASVSLFVPLPGPVVLRKAQTDRGWEWGVSAAWNSFPQQKDVKSWWWKQFDIMCFLMVHGDICRNMFARAPDVWDDLGGHQNVQAQNRLPRHPLVRECCTALCQARHCSPCYRSSLVTTSVWVFARVF